MMGAAFRSNGMASENPSTTSLSLSTMMHLRYGRETEEQGLKV